MAMTAEVIEGTAVEVEPERAVVVAQPGQSLVLGDHGATGMIAVATELANALSDIVERKRLFTVISGKKFPQVEAWMTIGRMDNVVAREAERPIRNEDGSYEAFVELVRLSDGMVIGRASALCGTQDDRPWNNRSEPARRSMAVTRATSRAFRQQYSWIMALAGYEPTPADEMPDANGETHQPGEPPARSGGFVGTEAHPVPELTEDGGGLIGTAITEKSYDFELHGVKPDESAPDAPKWKLPFRVKNGSKSFIVVAEDSLAEVLAPLKEQVIGKRVQVWGSWRPMTTPAKGTKPEVHYRILVLDRIATPDFTLPAVSVVPESSGEPVEAESVPLFGPGDMERLDEELAG
jgi:hypothetical protein